MVEHRAMRGEELKAFFGAVPEDRIAAYLLSTTDGLRKAELRRLLVGDVALSPGEGQLPHVRIRKTTAKNKRAHTLPLHPQVVPFLTPLVEGREARESLFLAGLPTHETFARDVERAGLVRETPEGLLTWTSLRKGLATVLDEAHVPEGLRQKVMRHATAGSRAGSTRSTASGRWPWRSRSSTWCRSSAGCR